MPNSNSMENEIFTQEAGESLESAERVNSLIEDISKIQELGTEIEYANANYPDTLTALFEDIYQSATGVQRLGSTGVVNEVNYGADNLARQLTEGMRGLAQVRPSASLEVDEDSLRDILSNTTIESASQSVESLTRVLDTVNTYCENLALAQNTRRDIRNSMHSASIAARDQADILVSEGRGAEAEDTGESLQEYRNALARFEDSLSGLNAQVELEENNRFEEMNFRREKVLTSLTDYVTKLKTSPSA